jgi:hypothetical protein
VKNVSSDVALAVVYDRLGMYVFLYDKTGRPAKNGNRAIMRIDKLRPCNIAVGFERRPPQLFLAKRDEVFSGSTSFSMPASKSDIVISSPLATVIKVSIVRLCSPRSIPPM